MKYIKDETGAGIIINAAIDDAIAKATPDAGIEFDFNGVTVRVRHDSDAALIYRDWRRGMLRPSGTFTVGPYPLPIVSEMEAEEDQRLREENDLRAAKAHEVYQAKLATEKVLLKQRLEHAPQMEFAPGMEAEWQKGVVVNTDGYGKAVVDFARNWARLMQVEIANGATVAECAGEAENLPASVEGLTGFQYGCAVSMLSQCWKHGEALRQWHNRATQIGDEGDRANDSGGVMNPALLSLGRAS